MSMTRFIEYGFLFLFILGIGYVSWLVFKPFLSVVAFSLIIVTLVTPFYQSFHTRAPWRFKGISAAIVLFITYAIIIGVISWFSFRIFHEAQAIYTTLSSDSNILTNYANNIQTIGQAFIPDFSFDITPALQNMAGFVVNNLSGFFTSTLSIIAFFLLSMLISFYLLRDGKKFHEYIVKMSPLQDFDDENILRRMAGAVRGVVFGVVIVALIQGLLTTIGLSVLGFDRAVLFGILAAFGALIPAVGAGPLVFIPLTIYLIASGQYGIALGVGIWGFAAVASIDNLLGPYLMRFGGVGLHPLVILLSVLGGIALFGIIGFVIGPVIFSIFIELLEIYMAHINTSSRSKDKPEYS